MSFYNLGKVLTSSPVEIHSFLAFCGESYKGGFFGQLVSGSRGQHGAHCLTPTFGDMLFMESPKFCCLAQQTHFCAKTNK